MQSPKDSQEERRKPSSAIRAQTERTTTERERLGNLFQNVSDTKGTCHAKMGSIKDRHGMDLTEAEDVEKRRQEYTEAPYKKDLHDPDHHNGVIPHLEPGILECEVKWAFESITMNKASGGDGLPVELLQILKDDAVKVLHSICQQIWKTQQWPQDWKRSIFIPIPKNAQTTAHLHSCHKLVKSCSKFSKPGFSNM